MVSDDSRPASPTPVLQDPRPVQKSAAIRGKRKRRRRSSSASVVHSSAAAASTAIDAAGLATDAASPSAAAAVNVVASMHTYAMPGFTHRPTKFTASTRRMSDRSSASRDDVKRTVVNESDAPNTDKQPVSRCSLNFYYYTCYNLLM